MVIEICKDRFKEILKTNNMLEEEIHIKAKVLSTKEAIGNPKRQDYPIIKGKEKLIQADFKGSKGQAFTDSPADFNGKLSEIIEMDLNNNGNIAILISSINSVLRYLGLISNTIHCKDEEPVLCSEKLAKEVKTAHGRSKIALIGLQPSMLETLSKENEVRVTDLDKDNIGTYKHGVLIEDAMTKTKEILDWSDIVIATGSTAANNSLDAFLVDKPSYFFGTTIAGVAYLLNLKRFCSESH